MSSREVVVLSAVRTAVGKFGGGLKDVPPTVLAAKVLSAAVQRSGLSPDLVGHVVFGNVIHTESKDMYLSRVAAISGGLPVNTPATNVNCLCGSGLQAILNAADVIFHNQCDAAVAGGVESMSRAPYWVPSLRWGSRMNNTTAVDALVAAITDPFENVHMGIIAENIAKKFGISRQAQDCLAVESHRRALAAIRNSRFDGQLVPIEVPSQSGPVAFARDENPREDATRERLAELRPAFREDGTVTPGNASSINDGAAALVLMERGAAGMLGLTAMARLLDYAVVGVNPENAGMAPVIAVRKVLGRSGLTVKDMDVLEVNEAFASQAIVVHRELLLPTDKTNPNGSGISLGHPIGATGAIITVKALHELQRVNGQYALVSMCVGGGQGVAAIFESVN